MAAALVYATITGPSRIQDFKIQHHQCGLTGYFGCSILNDRFCVRRFKCPVSPLPLNYIEGSNATEATCQNKCQRGRLEAYFLNHLLG